MIMKFCPRCRRLHPVGQKCPNGCDSRKEENKLYDKYFRKNKTFYNSSHWDKVRKECMNKFDNICVYTLFKYTKAIPAKLVHHIIELEEDESQAYELANLIPVSDIAHREIHKRYRDEDIKLVQAELREYLKLYTTQFLEG
ncbi:hypothetical protein [Fusobacterium mortiferum]|uniref:hypothetical protein n=1 Tax=Fusobacterium mortiferum TaxID=850 RepID=UPI001F15AB53|nr:hypothetical protein [Fusobacterium mortiferum]MCF2628329.1 hypothetical protein [Fusobacterium mortiferum]